MQTVPLLRAEQFASLEQAHASVLKVLVGSGIGTSPRGLATTELRAVSFAIADPRKRCITNPARRWSLPLAIGEFCWHASASADVNAIAYYAPTWRRFSDNEGNVRGSCYGKRVFAGSEQQPSQWQRLKALLQSDPSSRRAVLKFHSSEDELDPASNDVPCACTLQFLIRDGALDAIAYMRSNDVIWGMPYDVFLFTMLQELLACELGVKLGVYHHMAASLHVYSRHRELVHRILKHGVGRDFAMPTMSSVSDLPRFLDLEKRIRIGESNCREAASHMGAYWSDLASVLLWYRNCKAPKALRETMTETVYSYLASELA